MKDPITGLENSPQEKVEPEITAEPVDSLQEAYGLTLQELTQSITTIKKVIETIETPQASKDTSHTVVEGELAKEKITHLKPKFSDTERAEKNKNNTQGLEVLKILLQQLEPLAEKERDLYQQQPETPTPGGSAQ